MKNEASDIMARVRGRQYQSPSRARAAIRRNHLGRGEKRQLLELVLGWENEAAREPTVIGALPAVAPDASSDSSVVLVTAIENDPESGVFRLTGRVRLDARVRASLTPAGMSALYAARDRVNIPSDIVRRGGVWETTLREFMAVMGSAPTDDVLVDGNAIEIAG